MLGYIYKNLATRWRTGVLHHYPKSPSLLPKIHNKSRTNPNTKLPINHSTQWQLKCRRRNSSNHEQGKILNHKERMGVQVSPKASLARLDGSAFSHVNNSRLLSLAEEHIVLQSLFHNKALITTPFCERELQFYSISTSKQL